MKPDVSAPGVDITSSVPPRDGTWASFSGTSMASPHVAGAAALLRQRHPDWTVAQIKSALVLTGKPVHSAAASEAPTTREGGGLINLPAANDPLVFATPTDVSFGLLKPSARSSARSSISQTRAAARARGRCWSRRRTAPPGVTVAVPSSVDRAGRLDADRGGRVPPKATSPASSSSQQGALSRRIPYLVPGQRAEAGLRAELDLDRGRSSATADRRQAVTRHPLTGIRRRRTSASRLARSRCSACGLARGSRTSASS